MLHKLCTALAVTLLALATVSAVDSALASFSYEAHYLRSPFWP
jgi:hypothetical protein